MVAVPREIVDFKPADVAERVSKEIGPSKRTMGLPFPAEVLDSRVISGSVPRSEIRALASVDMTLASERSVSSASPTAHDVRPL